MSYWSELKIVFIKSPSLIQQNFLNDNNIKIIDLSIPLNDLRNDNIDPYYWNVTKLRGHWNHIAHRSIGQFIGQKIKESIEWIEF